jgi:hypothetical protein
VNSFGDFPHDFVPAGVSFDEKVYSDRDHQADESNDIGKGNQFE